MLSLQEACTHLRRALKASVCVLFAPLIYRTPLLEGLQPAEEKLGSFFYISGNLGGDTTKI